MGGGYFVVGFVVCVCGTYLYILSDTLSYPVGCSMYLSTPSLLGQVMLGITRPISFLLVAAAGLGYGSS